MAQNNTNPSIALAIPLYKNQSLSSFYGVVSSNIYLADISAYLSKAYLKTNYNVFIVDMVTMYLIATTMGSPLYYTSGGKKVCLAYRHKKT